MDRWHQPLGLIAAALLTAAASAHDPAAGGFAADRVPPVLPAEPRPLATIGMVPAAPASPPTPERYTLDDLARLALEQNPRLAQAALAVEAARGRAVQAGLYPNPVVSVGGEEIGDREGRGGLWTAPQVSQEIVRGGKLALSQAAAGREVDQAALALAARRAELLAAVRVAHWDVVALGRRVELLNELRVLTARSVEQTRRLVEAKQAAPLDVIQLEVEAERTRAEAEAAEQELPAAFRRLAAAVGAKDLGQAPVAGSLDEPLPDYDLDRLRQYVLATHPDVRSAQVGLERARLLWQRAQAEPTPNVTVSAGYMRNFQSRSNDLTVGVSLPVPVWNRNEGNIQAAQAQTAQAAREVQRVENELTERVAAAYRDFAAARRRAERLAVVRGRAEEAFRLVTEEKAFTLTAVQRLVSQQAVTQARLEYVRALGEAWRAASVISGLTLEEPWPPAVGAVPEKK